MSASENLGHQWQQLPMFMSPREIVNSVGDFGDRDSIESVDGLRKRKLRESRASDAANAHAGRLLPGNGAGESLYNSVKRDGVKEPITLDVSPGRMDVLDGHHRLFAAERARPDDLVPVEHTDYDALLSHLGIGRG